MNKSYRAHSTVVDYPNRETLRVLAYMCFLKLSKVKWTLEPSAIRILAVETLSTLVFLSLNLQYHDLSSYTDLMSVFLISLGSLTLSTVPLPLSGHDTWLPFQLRFVSQVSSNKGVFFLLSVAKFLRINLVFSLNNIMRSLP